MISTSMRIADSKGQSPIILGEQTCTRSQLNRVYASGNSVTDVECPLLRSFFFREVGRR